MLEPLIEFLGAHGLDAPADLAATPIGDGHSNVTFALSTGVVLRRPPRGPLPPSAHDVLREARLLRALEATRVRAPKVLAVCEDAGVIGVPFYVMERIDGEVITDSVPGRARHARAAQPDRRRADRRAGRAARHRLGRRRPGRLRQADRLPRAPAATLHRAVGAQPHARAAAGRGGRRVASVERPRVAAGDDRARRLPAREHDVRRRRPGAADRDLRLGDGDDRRPARRRRLHADALDRARRCRWASSTCTT